MPPLLAAPEVHELMAKPDEVDAKPDKGWGTQPCVAERHIGPLLLTCGPSVQRGNPFWVISVAPNVLHEHNGFFNPYFLAFARNLVVGKLE
jgi:hypothetical protein